MNASKETAARAVIVDDEPLARELLRGMLEAYPQVEVVAEAGDGQAAVEVVRREEPDLLFLDVQMPERDGFDVLRELGEEVPRALVFVTAYDQYALKAFEVSALDYLLKPFDEERLDRCVQRALGELRGGVEPERPIAAACWSCWRSWPARNATRSAWSSRRGSARSCSR